MLFGTGMSLKFVALGGLLLLAANTASSLTLGRAHGAAWIGQPLEIVVAATLDAGQTDSNLCADVDIFHGDARIDGNLVNLSVAPTSQPDQFNIRVSSSVLIDEPVVTVYLRAGCGQKTSRKYVLLADYANEELVAPAPKRATPPPVSEVSATAVSAAAKEGEQKTVPAQKLTPNADKASSSAQTASNPKPVQKPSPKVVQKPVQKPKTAKDHLQLDPIETLTERISTLEAATAAIPASASSAASAPVPMPQQIQQLQGEIKTLLELAATNESSLAKLRARLDQAESERGPSPLVYALAGLVVLCLAALALAWVRRPRQG
jgi:hypothetical protein